MIVQSRTTMGSSVSHWEWSRCALQFTLVLGTVCLPTVAPERGMFAGLFLLVPRLTNCIITARTIALTVMLVLNSCNLVAQTVI